MHPMGEMVEMQISPSAESEPLTLNLHVVSGKALWGYIDLPVLAGQDEVLKEVTDHIKKGTEATIGTPKKRVKFKYEGESIETETTTADVYSWIIDYGLRYSLPQLTRLLTALDSAVRDQGGRGLEGNEFFVVYRSGSLFLQEPSLSFVLVTSWGYYSAFLSIGEENLELHIVDEEKEAFQPEKFEQVVEKAITLFESEENIVLPDSD